MLLITYRKTRSLLPPHLSSGDLGSEEEVLEIPSITRQKAGTYECTAVNDIGTDVQTVEITVNCESASLPACGVQSCLVLSFIQGRESSQIVVSVLNLNRVSECM